MEKKDERPEAWDDLPYYEKNPQTVFQFKMPADCMLAEYLNAAGKMVEQVEKLYAGFTLNSEVNYGRVEITREWTADEKADKLAEAQKRWDRENPAPKVSEEVLAEVRAVSADNDRKASLIDTSSA